MSETPHSTPQPNPGDRLVFDPQQWGAGSVIPQFERLQEQLSLEVATFDPAIGYSEGGVDGYDLPLPLEPWRDEQYAPTGEDHKLVGLRKDGLLRDLSSQFEDDGLMPSTRRDSPSLLYREFFSDEDRNGETYMSEYREVTRRSDGKKIVAVIETFPSHSSRRAPEVRGVYLLTDATAQQFRDTRRLVDLGVPLESVAGMAPEHRRALVETYDITKGQISSLPGFEISQQDLTELDALRHKLTGATIPKGLFLSITEALGLGRAISADYDSVAAAYEKKIESIAFGYRMDSDTANFLVNTEEIRRLQGLNETLRQREAQARRGRIALAGAVVVAGAATGGLLGWATAYGAAYFFGLPAFVKLGIGTAIASSPFTAWGGKKWSDALLADRRRAAEQVSRSGFSRSGFSYVSNQLKAERQFGLRASGLLDGTKSPVPTR